jgi:hypothetical protein
MKAEIVLNLRWNARVVRKIEFFTDYILSNQYRIIDLATKYQFSSKTRANL